VVDTMLVKKAKSNHQNKTDKHNGTTVCETRRQQQDQRIYNERRGEQNVPDTVDTSQLLNEVALFRLVHIECQH